MPTFENLSLSGNRKQRTTAADDLERFHKRAGQLGSSLLVFYIFVFVDKGEDGVDDDYWIKQIMSEETKQNNIGITLVTESWISLWCRQNIHLE